MTGDDEILACEDELRRAQLTSNVEALDRLLDEELVFTSIDGTLASKGDDLALHASGRLRITRMEPIERRTLHLGDTSVVSVKMDAAAVMDGMAIGGILKLVTVFANVLLDGVTLCRHPVRASFEDLENGADGYAKFLCD